MLETLLERKCIKEGRREGGKERERKEGGKWKEGGREGFPDQRKQKLQCLDVNINVY